MHVTGKCSVDSEKKKKEFVKYPYNFKKDYSCVNIAVKYLTQVGQNKYFAEIQHHPAAILHSFRLFD